MVELHAAVYGADPLHPHKPHLLVLHGLFGMGDNWATLARQWSDHWVVHTLDLRNHGQSPWDAEHTYAALAADVLAYQDRTNLPAAVWLGHSMGGKAAMRLAVDRPDLVARLTIVDIAPRAYADRVRVEFAAMNALDLAAVTSRKDAEVRLAAQVPEWGMRQFILTNLGQDAEGRWRWTVNRAALTAGLPAILGNPLAPGEVFAGPTRFIRGGKSDYIRDADVATIRAHFPVADLVTLPESGHNPHFDARTGFVEAVTA